MLKSIAICKMFIQEKEHEFATMLSVEVNLQCNGTIGIVFRQNASEKPVAKWGKLKRTFYREWLR
jgi:hypothetical protein